MTEEKKPEEQTKPTEPTRADETDKDKYQETSEDVKKSREFFQDKAQQETAKREEVEAEREELEGELQKALQRLDQNDPMRAYYEQQQKQPQGQQESGETKDEEEFNFDDLDDTDVRSMLKLVHKRLDQSEQRLRNEIQRGRKDDEERQLQRMFADEDQRAQAEVNAVMEKAKLSGDTRKAIITKADEYIPIYQQIGAPTRWAKLVLELVNHERLESSVQERAKTAQANAAAQVAHAKNAAQPSGAAISPPAPKTLEEWNKQEADAIADDDRPVE